MVGTPAPVIRRLHGEITRVLAMPDIREKFLQTAVEPVGNTPAQYSAIMKAELARMGKVIRNAGIRAE
jgi:tripartite-type tricarboxylate transporter receptor subunit TctC